MLCGNELRTNFHQFIYHAYTCLLLAVVETRSGAPDPAPESNDSSAAHSVPDQREEHWAWENLDFEDHETLVPTWASIAKGVLQQCWLTLRALHPWLIADTADKHLATQDLTTCMAHLGYIAGNSWLPLRAIGSCLGFWVVQRRILVGITALVFWLVVAFAQMLSDMIKTPWGAPDEGPAWAPSWPFVLLAVAICGLDPCNGFVFHTL